MAFVKNGKLIRRCNICSITNDIIPFKKLRDTKSGKIYTHNICKPCFEDRRALQRRKYYKKHRKEEIAVARQWNIDNKKRYNKRRRIKNKFFKGCLDNLYRMEMI
jgi:hypothetical protein